MVPLYRLASFCEAYSEEWALDQDEVGIVMLLVPLFPGMQEKHSNTFFSLCSCFSPTSHSMNVFIHLLTFLSLHQPPHRAHFPQNSLQGALTVTHTAGGLWHSRRGYICWKVSVNWLVVNYPNKYTFMGKVCLQAMALTTKCV